MESAEPGPGPSAGPSSSSATATTTSTTSSNNTQKDAVVYQFKIGLKRFKPLIWRRVQVPGDYNFAQLHKVIIIAMKWSNTHLHKFEMENEKKTKIGIKRDIKVDWFGDEQLDEKTALIADQFKLIPGHMKASYTYDFGDSWDHYILLEKILPAVKGKKYPVCVSGKRARPPEDGTESEWEDFDAEFESGEQPVFKAKDVDFSKMESENLFFWNDSD